MKDPIHRLAVAGAWMQLIVPAVYLDVAIKISAAIGRMDFAGLEDDKRAIIGEVNAVTSELGAAFEWVPLGKGVAIAGLTFFIIALTKYHYRRRWAFWFSCLYGGFLLLPLSLIGVPFGIFLLAYALNKRTEFERPLVKQLVLNAVPVEVE